jgi:hypothetical protein
MNELSHEARRLIEAVSNADGPSEQRLEAVGRGLFRQLAAGVVTLSTAQVAAAAAAPAASALKLSGLLAYFVIGGTVGVGVAVTAAALGTLGTRPAAISPPLPSSTETASAALPSRSAFESDTSAPSRDDAPSTPPPTERVPERAPSSSVAPTRQSTLSAEVERLNEIQSFLAAGDGARALAASDRYFAEFTSGELRDEHVAARVLALCLLGDVTRARDAARMFVTRSPASPLLPRLARSCVADVIGNGREPRP